jgi:hypothetical protein
MSFTDETYNNNQSEEAMILITNPIDVRFAG